MKKILVTFISLVGLVLVLQACSLRSTESELPGLKSYDNLFLKVATEEGGAEIITYDDVNRKLFVINGVTKKIDVVELSQNILKVKESISLSRYGRSLNSIAYSDGMVAVAIGASNTTDRGKVVILNSSDYKEIANITVGVLPDMVTFSPNGKWILVANEGEPNDNYTINPEGTISIIEVAKKSVVRTVNFDSVKVPGNYFKWDKQSNASLAQDIEPEYLTVSSDSSTAYAALQENNGIAKIELATGAVTLYGLGAKDFNLPANKLDYKENGEFKLENIPVSGLYQPDAIAYYEVGGEGYLISANEGDGREYPDDGSAHNDTDKIKKILDKVNWSKFSAEEKKLLAGPVSEAELRVLNNFGTNSAGKFDEILISGARSFSIWKASDLSLVYDSGSELAIRANAAKKYDEGRSPKKGTEPEGLAVFVKDGKTYAVIGLERANIAVVYDVSNPKAPVYHSTISNDKRHLSPEGIVVIPAEKSPNGKTLIAIGYENSSSLGIVEFD